MTFDYGPWPLSGSRDFRLLSLHPGTGSATLECDLKVVSLDNSLSYEALSYVWGDPSSMLPIRCNGQELDITQNLHAALLRLRRHDEERVIWVDAISINQKSNDDRNAQVPLMHDIYARAKAVTIWLGEEAEGVAEAWHLLKNMAQAQDESETWYMTLPKTAAGGKTWIEMIEEHQAAAPKELELPLTDSLASRGLQELLQRQWFERCWVLQEVTVAGNCFVQCGGHTTKWDAFVKACRLIRENETETIRPIQEAAVQADYMTVLYRSQKASLKKSSGEIEGRHSLFKLQTGTHSLKASNSRDKVFSLLGLCFGSSSSGSDVPALLRPNYSASVAEIYSKAAHYTLAHNGDLELLSHVARDPDAKGLEDLPSWVPDWQTEVQLLLIGRGRNFHAGPSDPVSSLGALKQRKYSRQSNPPPKRSFRWETENRYGDDNEDVEAGEDENGKDSASAISPPPAPATSNPLHLHIRGVPIDRIRLVRSDLWISDVHLASEDPESSVNDIRSSTYESFWRNVLSFYVAEKVRPELYDKPLGGHLSPPARTIKDPFLSYNDSSHGHKKRASMSSGPSISQIQTLHIRVTRASLELPSRSFQRGASPEEEATGWQYLTRYIPPAAWGMRYMVRQEEADDMVVDRLTRECWLLMARMRVGRSVIVTESGWVGIAPEWVRESDVIVVARGGRVPLVLRESKEGGMWRLVGECYLHGIMNGEIEEWASKGKELEEKDYVLC